MRKGKNVQHGDVNRRGSFESRKFQGLGAPVASIGGAGTFDGVFLTGILAVLLSPVGGPPHPQERKHDSLEIRSA